MREDEQCLPGCRERAEGCVLQPPRSVRAVPGHAAVPGLLLPSRGSAVPGGACGARGSVLGLRCSEIPPETSTEQRNFQRLRVNITRAGSGVLLRLWGAAHTTHNLPCRQGDGRQEQGEAFCEVSKAIFCLLRYLCGLLNKISSM